mmetsp:Transcript_72644/g.170227  ORF Transcript_72644/g.170227 Transcript_72644/m.170227 type:complete len:558 (+) Transcript_72644:112-1785(+)
MGVCVAKQATARDGQSPQGNESNVTRKTSDNLTISLDRAKAMSFNAATTHARYHSAGGRKLEDDYEIFPKRVLGEGCSGLVIMAKGRHDGRKYALKRIHKLKVQPKVLKQLTAEVEIYLMLDHPHIAALRDVYESESEIALLTECCEGGELYSRLSNSGTYAEADAAEATHQMLLAVGYLHAHHVVHRDLKLENFLYETAEPNAALKLIDFGFAKIWDPSTLMMASCGSIAYVSPDVLKGDGYTSKCDLWSLGVTVFILLFGYMPFSGNEDKQISDIKHGRYTVKPAKWDGVSQTAQDFVKKLLVVKPTARLTAEGAFNHPFIANRNDLTNQVNNEVVAALVDFGQASSFRRACMSMMAWSLTNEERSQVRMAFIQMDEDKTGAIKIGEFKKVLEDKCHIKSEEATKIFQALDTTQSDEIHYSEFLAAMVSTRIALHDDLLLATFKRFDKDNSGKITVENLREVLGETFEGNAVENIMVEADLTGSGDISYEEWMQYLRSGRTNEAHAEMAAKLIDNRLQGDPNKTIAIRSNKQVVAQAQGGSSRVKQQDISCCCIA